jgi:mevalonate kinase
MREVLQGLLVQTKLEFDRHWGLGSSSTLVSLLAQWFDIPPYDLFNRTQTGSGYDLACATAEGPILYQLQQGQAIITPVRFQPTFQSQLYFVYLGQKQFSDREVKAYLGHGKPDSALLQEVSDLTRSLVQASSLDEFAGLLEAHEALLSAELRRPTVQQQLFASYPGQVKSLGAWGGDFVLATAPDPAEALAWLQNNAFKTVVPYDQMI